MFKKMSFALSTPAPERLANSLITITEKKASTEESIRLLKEIEKEILEKIMGVFEIKNNIFSGIITFFASIGPYVNYRIKFQINGKEIYFDGKIREDFYYLSDKSEIIKIFWNGIIEELTKIFITKNSTEISDNLFKLK